VRRAELFVRVLPDLCPHTPDITNLLWLSGEKPLTESATNAIEDHAAGWRLGQAKTGLTATHPGEELRATRHRSGGQANHLPLPPRGIARSVAPASPPRPGRLPSRMTNPSRAEPSGRPPRCGPFPPMPPVSGHAVTKRPAPRWNRPSTGRDGSQAAVTGSAAKPRSGKAQHHISLDRAVAARIFAPLRQQPSRRGRARPYAHPPAPNDQVGLGHRGAAEGSRRAAPQTSSTSSITRRPVNGVSEGSARGRGARGSASLGYIMSYQYAAEPPIAYIRPISSKHAS